MTPPKYAYHFVFLLCCLYTSSLVKGQGTCSGSALAPVFSQTFGQGGSSSSKTSVPSGFTTNYTFQSSGALNDGAYIVTPRVQNSGRNDWAQGSDHTGNSNGNMFLVNAGTGGSVFFTQQVDNLCPGSTYNFSAWLANVNTTSNTLPICGSGYVYPNVTFNIKNTSGDVLATYSTGNLPLTVNRSVPPNWQQYGFTFALPSGTTSLVLEMVDAYGGQPQCGNDLAIDDILFTACTPTASINFTTASTVCSGTNTTIASSIVNSPFTNPAYQWQKSTDGGTTWNNIGTPGTSATNFDLNNISSADQASYRVLVGPDVASLSSNTCITASSAISLTVIQSPSASVGSNSPVCSGNYIQLTSTVSNNIATTTYNWSGPGGFNTSATNPLISNAQVSQSGTYTLLVTSGNNCTATASTNVIVNATPAVAAITGNDGGCVGSSFTLSNATAGGTWNSFNPSVASIDNNGLVTLLQDGTTTISYTVTANGCSNTVTKTISVASVSLAPSLIECNNGVRSYSGSSSNPYYVNYGNNSGGNTYLWTFTNTGTGLVETTIYKSGTDQNSQYPSVQLPNGNIYNVSIQFTSNGVTCSAQHTVYKQVLLTGQISSAQDTTVCYTASNIPLRGSASAVATSTTWRTLNGSGSFSSTNSLNTTYTPSTADKTAGTVFIVFDVATSLNMNGNCGSATASDTMALHILPSNAGTNTTATTCSGALFQHTSSSAVSGSSFTWTSTVLSGTGSGNAANGTGNISNTLTNSSTTTDFVVQYTITPAYNGCTGIPYTVTVTVKPLPSLSITNNSSVICTGTITNITVSSSLSNTQYSWVSSVISGTASGASVNASTTTVNTITDILSNTGITNAIVRYTITGVTANGCTSTAQTDVTITPAPSTADAGSNQSHCNVPYTSLNAQTPTVGTGTWSLVSGPGAVSFSDINDPATTISSLTTGTYTFKWTVSNGTCTSTEDEVSVTIYAATVAGTITGNNTVCATGNSGTISLTGNTGAILNWNISIDNGNSWNTISNTTNTLNYNNLTTTTLYRATVQNGVCTIENTNNVTITVMQTVTTALAGNDQTICATNTTTLAANQPVSGTGTWTQIAGPTTAGFVNVNAYNTVVNNLNTGSYTFRWTISNGVCADSYDEVSITINAATVAGTISADNTVCATGNTGSVSLTGNTGNILNWSMSIDNGNSWNTIINTTNTLNYNNLTTTTLYRATVQNGICNVENTNNVTITVLQPPTTAIAGSDQTLNNVTTATLNGNNPVSGIGTWTQVAGPTTAGFVNANAYNTVVNNLATGTYTFRWTITNGVCGSSFDEMMLTIEPPTVPGTLSADATVCAVGGNGATLQLTGYTGSILQWEFSVNNGSNWSTISNTTNQHSYSNLTATTLFRALVQNGIGLALYSNTVTITVMQAVTTAIAGNDQILCATNTASLAASQPVSGTGTWTQIAGPTTAGFVNANAYNTVVNNLVTGTYTFRWTISNGVCADSYDEVSITINAATVAGTITGNNTVCATGNSGAVSLTGNTGNILNWAMSIDNGNSWNTISNTTNTLNYNNLSTTTLYRATVQNGVCTIENTNTITITVMQAVTTAIAGNDQILCATNTASLAANQPVSGTGTWTQIAGPTTAGFVNANAYNTVVNNLVTGTYTFRWTISNGVCADSYDEVSITINAATVAGTITGNNTVCAAGNSGAVSLTGNTGNILNWAMSIDNGNSWNTISNTTNTLNYNNLSTTTLYRATVQNGVCTIENTNTITVTVDAITNPGVLTGAATVCNGINTGNITLAGNNGTVIHWEYSVDGGSNWTIINNTANSYTFNNLTINTLFRVLVQNGVCSNTYSNNVAITLDPVTIPGTLTGNNTVCYGTNSGSVQLSGNNGTVQYWEYSTDGGISWNNIAQTSTSLSYNNLTQSTMYRAVVRSGVCTSATTNSITISVTALSVGGTVTGNTTVCSGSNNGLLTLTGNTGSVLEWQSSTDGGNTWTSIANTTSSFTYNNITATTQYRAVVQNGVCSAVYSSPATITVDAVTVPGSISGGGHYCSGSNSGNITLSGNNGNIIQWEVSTNNGSSWSIIANTTGSYQFQNLTTTSQFRVLVQNGVCGAAYSNIVTVQIADVVVNTIAQTSYTVCDGQTVTVNAAPATGGTGTYLYQWQYSTDGINWSDIAGANAAVYSFIPAANISMLRRVVNSLPCSQISNIVTVTKQAAISNNILSANTVICFDSTTQITGTVPTGGDGVYTYIWQFSTDGGTTWNNIAGATGKDFTTAALTVQTVYRRIARTLLCTGPQENISNNITIGIKYKPTAIFTVLPDTGCSPVLINFQNQSTGNNTIFLYSFGDGKDTLVNNRSAISHWYTTNALATLSTRLLAMNECGVDTTYKTVTIKPDDIQPNLLLSDSSLCGPGTIRFTNNTTGALTYRWDFGDGTPIISNTTNTTIDHPYTQPGVYQFTLVADNECSIKTIRHTIRIHPTAVAAFITNQPDYCVGDSVRFTNQSSNANQYRWFFGNNDSATAVNPVSVYKQAGTFEATLIAKMTYAPDYKTCFDTSRSTITVVGTRKGTMQVNSLTGICLPHTINTLSLNTPAASVVWNWGDDSSSRGETASHKYFSNGQYMVTMIATSAGGCQFIDSTNIVVNGPTGTLSFSKNDICLGESVLFNTIITGNTLNQADSIRWYPGDGTVQTTTVNSFTYQYAKAGVYHPKAWLIKANGCMVPLINTDSIRVDEVVSKFGLSGVFECGTTTYQFVDSSRSVFGIRSWKWVMNGRDSSFERTKVSRFTQKSSNTTSLIVEGNTGCKASSQVNYDVQVYQYPVANISAMAEACKTDLLELKSNVNSQDSVALRLWTLGNGISAKDSIVKATFVNDGTYNIKLTVATVNNCYDSVYKQLTVHPLPKITVDQNNTVCRGDSITIRANGASRFIWKDQNENIICTDCSEIKIKPVSSMGYKVIGYNQFGCSEIKSTTVRVINPLKMIASIGDTICAGQSSNLSATGAASYQWLPNKEFTGGTTSGIYVRPTETTTYKVVGKDAFNCFVDTAEIKVVVGKPTPVTLGKDTTLVSGGSYQLRLQSANNDIVKWRWSGAPGISCATCPAPVVKLSEDACISCTAINQYGCVSSDTICIKTFCPTTEVFVPNAFTPDGDGINDKLVVQGKGIRLIKSFRIFNRWGEVVFEKVNFNPGDPAYGWDGKVRGKEASPDVYVYVCEVICEKGLPSIFKGNTAILK
jgi:gliding motility-associated-like protein